MHKNSQKIHILDISGKISTIESPHKYPNFRTGYTSANQAHRARRVQRIEKFLKDN